jgi:predicted negative regulator of RcsB-dependent stress response
VDELLSEKEQVEKLRNWWKENGPFVIGGLLLGVLALSGWNYWQGWKIEQAEAAKAAYDTLVIAAGNADAETSAAQLATLEDDFAGTPYVDQGRLMMAKLEVDAGRLDQAATLLSKVVDQTDDPELARIARMRLARVLLAEGDTDGALAALPLRDAGVFAARYHELRGDILARRGEIAAAREEYGLALETASAGIVDAASVQIKLEALGAGVAAEAGGES